MNGSESEAERDQQIWRRASRPKPTLNDIRSGSLLSALEVAHDALGWRDFDLAQQAVDAAHRLAPDDHGVTALGIWIGCLRRTKPSPDHLEAMRRLANDNADAMMPKILLIRMLLLVGDVAGAQSVAHFLDDSENAPSAEVARAQLLVAEGDARAGLRLLQQLRNRWPARSFGLLTYEMILAASIRDQEAFRKAYVERSRLEERRPSSLLPPIWMGLRIWLAVLAIVWGIGAIFNLAWLWISAVMLFFGYTVIHWRTLRSRSLSVKTGLMGLGLFAIGLATSILYRLFG